MGSTFSVTNDSAGEIWVWDGANWEALKAVGGLVTFAATKVLNAGSLGMAGDLAKVATNEISKQLDGSEKEAKDDKEATEYFKNNSVHLAPGETYTSPSYSLSLMRGVYLMNSDCKQVRRTCWSGMTANSNIAYSSTNDFEWN